MSHFLFLVVVEVLSRVVRTRKREGHVKGIRMGNLMSLSYLLLIDDAISLGTCVAKDAQEYKKIMDIIVRKQAWR